MTDTQHTEGPWHSQENIRGPSGHFVKTEDGTTIADVRGRDGQPDKANARLIAAAPTLLERLKDARDAFEALPEDALGRDPDVGYPYLMELKDYIDDAIAKAEGR